MKQPRIQINISLRDAKILEQLIADFGVQYDDLNYKKLALKLHDMIINKQQRLIREQENPYEFTAKEYGWNKEATDKFLS